VKRKRSSPKVCGKEAKEKVVRNARRKTPGENNAKEVGGTLRKNSFKLGSCLVGARLVFFLTSKLSAKP